MKEVSAVKDKNMVANVGRLLEKHHGRQIAQIWELGLNLALRISDLLSLKFSDIINDDGKKYIQCREMKTKKYAKIALNSEAQRVIEEIRSLFPSHLYIFQSYRSNRIKNKIPQPLRRNAVSKAFAHIGEIVGIHLGTHSMRKTRGYHIYIDSGNDIGLVMKVLRHSSQSETLRYIGIERQNVDDSFIDMPLFGNSGRF